MVYILIIILHNYVLEIHGGPLCAASMLYTLYTRALTLWVLLICASCCGSESHAH